jgi:hypothetical protein
MSMDGAPVPEGRASPFDPADEKSGLEHRVSVEIGMIGEEKWPAI